ncbi:unnamed protein product, partial [Oppiella nova]
MNNKILDKAEILVPLLAIRPLICPSDGKCNITTESRTWCQKCRLNKCFAVGMKKEFIRDVEANELRKQLIKENKQKTQQNNENNSVDKPIDNSVDNFINDTSNETKLSDETYAQEIEALIGDSLNISDEALSEQIMEIESYVIKDTKKVEKVAKNTNPLAVMPIFKVITDYKGFNRLEFTRMSELLSASNVINNPFSTNITEIRDYDLFMRSLAKGNWSSNYTYIYYRGRHFTAITCDSCKSFFRRTALKNKPLYCISDGKCDIKSHPRNICQKCRYDKCLLVGMRKELIQNTWKNQLISDTKHNDTSDVTKHCDDTIDTEIDDLINKTLNISDEEICEQIMDIENSVTNNSTENNSLEIISQNSVIPITKGVTDYNGFNQLECTRITELFQASNIINYPVPKNVVKITDLSKLVSITAPGGESHVQNTVKLIKSLSGFQSLCQNDQFILVKYGCFDLIVLRLLNYYDIRTQSYIFPM